MRCQGHGTSRLHHSVSVSSRFTQPRSCGPQCVNFVYIVKKKFIQSARRPHVYHTFSCPHRKFVFTSLVRECSTYARIFVRLLYLVCDHVTFSIHSITARWYEEPVISAYGAGPPGVIKSWKWATHCINQDLRDNSCRFNRVRDIFKILYWTTSCKVYIF